MILNDAINVCLGQETAQAVYSRQELIWPSNDVSYYFTVENNNANLLYYYGNKSTIKMGQQIDGYDIKIISDTCHSYDEITSIKIPDGVTEIE